MKEFSYESGPGLRGTSMSFKLVGGKVKITCDSSAVECHHELARKDFKEFVNLIGASELEDPIDAVAKVVAEGGHPKVYDAVHTLAKTTFSWISTDW